MRKKAGSRAKSKATRRAPRAARKPAPKAARPAAASGRPAGFHAVTPALTVRGAAQAIDFYKRAFGAREIVRMPGPGGMLMHAEIRIGDSVVMLGDESPAWGARGPQSLGGVTGSLHLYVKDVDAAVEKARAAGATVKMPPEDMFWGDRYAKLVDPFGHEWGLATQKERLSIREQLKRGEAFVARMIQGGPGGPASAQG